MVGYYLLTEGHSIQLGSGGGHCGQGSILIMTILILIIIFSEFPIKSQSNHSLNFLIKLFLNKKQCVFHTYDVKYLNAAGKQFVKKNQLRNDHRSNEQIKKSLSFGKYTA